MGGVFSRLDVVGGVFLLLDLLGSSTVEPTVTFVITMSTFFLSFIFMNKIIVLVFYFIL